MCKSPLIAFICLVFASHANAVEYCVTALDNTNEKVQRSNETVLAYNSIFKRANAYVATHPDVALLSQTDSDELHDAMVANILANEQLLEMLLDYKAHGCVTHIQDPIIDSTITSIRGQIALRKEAIALMAKMPPGFYDPKTGERKP